MAGWRETMEQVGDGLRSPLDVVPGLEALDDLELVGLEADEALAVIELVRRATAALDAVQVLALEAVARRTVGQVDDDQAYFRARGELSLGPQGDEVAAVELGAALRVGRRAMSSLLGDARLLVRDLPQTLGLLRAGRLDLTRARVVAQQGLLVERGHRGAYDDAVVHPDQVSRRYRLGPTDLDVPALRRRVASAAAHVDPESERRRAESARRDAFVRVVPGPEPGMSSWTASLPSEDSAAVWAAIDELAEEYLRADPALAVGVARAQALVSLVLARASITTTVDITVPLDAWPVADRDTAAEQTSGTSSTPGPESDRPRLRLVPDLTWSVAERGLADLVEAVVVDRDLRLVGRRREDDDGTDSGRRGRRPRDVGQHGDGGERGDGGQHDGGGQDDGGGPDDGSETGESSASSPPTRSFLPPSTPSATWSVGVQPPMVGFVLAEAVARLLADPDTRVRLHGCHPTTGALLTHDPTTYRPAVAVARAVRARDGHCRFPGCSVPANRTQLDHVVPFPLGQTTVDNLACLCVTHHRFKTHLPWSYVLAPDGLCTWTSPLGRAYVTEPAAAREKAA